MELVLTKKEVEEMLLDAVEKQLPGMFNHVEIDCSYSSIKCVTFSKRKDGEEE